MSTTTELPFHGAPPAAQESPLAAGSARSTYTPLSRDSTCWKALLGKRINRVAITIKHTDASKEELQTLLLDSTPFTYVRFAQEQHKKQLIVNGSAWPHNAHLHAIAAGTRFQFGTMYKRMLSA